MRRYVVLRNMAVITALSFTIVMMFTMLAGAEYANKKIWEMLFCCLLYGIMSGVFYSETILEKVGPLVLQIAYVIMLNVVYIVVGKISGWGLTFRDGLINAIAIVGIFIFIRLVIFSMDRNIAEKMNEMLKRRKNRNQ